MTDIEREKAKGNIMAFTGTVAYVTGSLATFATVAYEGMKNLHSSLYAGLSHVSAEVHIDPRSIPVAVASLGIAAVGAFSANKGVYVAGMAEIEEMTRAQ